MKSIPFGIIAAAAFGLFLAAYFPVFQILAAKWAGSEEYTHAFLTLPIILYMAWGKRAVLLEGPVTFSSLGLVVLLLAAPLYFFTLLTQVHTIIALAMYITVVGVLIYLAGIRAVKELFTPLLLLLLLIPVPEQLYTQVTFPLQLLVSQISELVIRTLGVPIFRQGNVMQIPEKSFEVVEACSGLRSVITLLTLSVIMGYFMLRKPLSKLILVAASVPVAIFVNIIRIVAMILLYQYFKLDLTEGIWHTVTGLLVFLIALFALFLLQKVLEYWESLFSNHRPDVRRTNS